MAGYCDSGAYSGKRVQLSYFLGCVDTPPDPEDYIVVGWRRDLSFSVTWADSDATTAGTNSSIRTFIQTFKEIAGDFSGIANRDAQLKALRRYITAAKQGTSGWVRLLIPDESGAVEIIEFQVIFTNYGFNTGYEDPATNDVGWKAVAEPVFTDVASFTLTVSPDPVTFVSGAGGTTTVTASGGASAAATVTTSSPSLTSTIDNGTGIITLASAVAGSYVLEITSAVDATVGVVVDVTVS
jgi:hypothetical protein